MVEQAQAIDCETCIFLGDWHHHRASVNVSTLNYSVEIVAKLSKTFKKVYMITGNHDLYYREKRDYNSLPYAELFDNVHLINEKTLVQDDTEKCHSVCRETTALQASITLHHQTRDAVAEARVVAAARL